MRSEKSFKSSLNRIAQEDKRYCCNKKGISCLRQDPSRYRPASEALIRRILQGKELYQRDTLVDLVNLASIAYGYSIGGFDADKFEGDTLILGVGKAGEPYEGIGRGMINIEGLPVYRDEAGGVGTPTNDHERTKMTLGTTHLVVLINGYDGNEQHVRENAEFDAALKQILQEQRWKLFYLSMTCLQFLVPFQKSLILFLGNSHKATMLRTSYALDINRI